MSCFHLSHIFLFLSLLSCFAVETLPATPQSVKTLPVTSQNGKTLQATSLQVTVKPYIQSYTQGRIDLRRDTVIYKQEKVIFGLNIKINEIWSASVGFDYSFSKNIPYLKPASLTYRKDRWTMDAGIFYVSELDKSMSQFWSNRFIERVAIDKWMLLYSADLGVRATYRWNDFITTDVSFLSGNGYMQLREKYHPRPSFRAIITPLRPLQLGGLIAVRKGEGFVETTFSSFAHLQMGNKWKVTGEYFRQTNSRLVEGQRMDLLSVYGTYYLTAWMGMMGRYDFINTNRIEPLVENWNVRDDGQMIIGGLIFRCLPTMRVSLSYWGKRPVVKRLEKEDWLYVCLEFKY